MQPQQQQRNALIAWIVILAIGVCVGGFFGFQAIVRANAVAPFNKDLASYLVLNNAGRSAGAAKVKGKMITVDINSKAIDHLYFDLPEELRASKPEEVATVVLLSWGKNKVGTYDGGSGAYQQTCQVKVVDKATNTEIASNFFLGDEPPQQKMSNASGTGAKPSKALLYFLKTLPRQ
jgi:hypothetical protein